MTLRATSSELFRKVRSIEIVLRRSGFSILEWKGGGQKDRAAEFIGRPTDGLLVTAFQSSFGEGNGIGLAVHLAVGNDVGSLRNVSD